MTEHVTLREFIERVIAENNLRRDDLRTEDRRYVDEALKSWDKALKLQAEAYPTTRDFNNLKSHVDVALATRAGVSQGIITLFAISSGLALIISVTVAILAYMK